MELKRIREFRSSMRLLPAFQSIDRKSQPGFLADSYNLAKAKYEDELWMENAHKEAKYLRASSTLKLRRVAQHIKNALVYIEKAKTAAPAFDRKLIEHLQILEAAHILRAAYDDLGFLIGTDITTMHPHHRTELEKRHRAIYQNRFLSAVEEKYAEKPTRSARMDYSLVAAISSRIDKCATSSGAPLRPIFRYRIISHVFFAALGQHYPTATVKTAILRTAGQQLR